MSPKNPPRDPRIAPKEMIVTRRKSAQQKRQLRDKDRSMKSITQLLKSPSRSVTSPKKAKVSPKKSPKKKLLQATKGDAQPVERRPREERVWLKHKHNFKMVARTNKRKLCTPHKEIDPAVTAVPVSPGSPEPLDMAQLIEETDSLDDEDLMEILTCPSPVWWEDPPDPRYTEKAICTRSPSLLPQNPIEKEQITIENVTNKKSDKNDPKFLKKQNKLENILGSIKNKKNIQKDDNDAGADCELFNDEILKSLENMDIPIEPQLNVNDVIKKEKKEKKQIKIEKDDKKDEVHPKVERSKRKDEMPMKVPENLPPLQRNPRHTASVLGMQKIARRNSIPTIKIKENNEILAGNSSNTKTDSKHNLVKKTYARLSRVVKNQVNDDRAVSLEENSQGISISENNEMKRNSDNSSPELEKKEPKDLDTISDTNIKFIDKVEDKDLDDTSQIILDKIKKFFQEKEKKMKQKEYITVYKIVDNEEKSEIKNDDQSKINYFYKKCKNVRKKHEGNDVKKEYSNKTLALPNSEVKYCFRCSSIFETKECHYCAKSDETRECVCDQSQKNRSDLSCNNCDSGEQSEHVNFKK